ncbi:MAG: nitrate transporter substrate-binding protein [Ilumatobacteraceae bacterium]|nr:nitrate transporter substrate-binding protein [Ilumatobacteraceae bacterium]
MHVTPMLRRARAAMLVVAVTTLAACGSSGGSSSTSPATTAAAASTAAATTVVSPSTSSPTSAAVASTSSAAAPASTLTPSDPYTLRVGFISTNQNWGGPEGYSHANGKLDAILAASGATKLELAAFPNGPNLNQAVQAGALDIGLYGDTPAIVAKSGGLDSHVLVQSSVGIDAWIVTKTGGPATVEDLAGKSIAVAQGSYMDRYLRGLLAQKGLTNDVTVVNIVPPPDQKAALDRGDIAAIASTATAAVLLRNQGYVVIDEAATDHPDLVGTSVTVITGDALRKHPELPATWRAAHAAAVDEINAAPDAFNQYTASAQGIGLAVMKEINVLGADGTFAQYPRAPFTDAGRTLLEGTKSFLVDNKYAKQDFSLDDWLVPT